MAPALARHERLGQPAVLAQARERLIIQTSIAAVRTVLVAGRSREGGMPAGRSRGRSPASKDRSLPPVQQHQDIRQPGGAFVLGYGLVRNR
jgi:hypothetical protein